MIAQAKKAIDILYGIEAPSETTGMALVDLASSFRKELKQQMPAFEFSSGEKGYGYYFMIKILTINKPQGYLEQIKKILQQAISERIGKEKITDLADYISTYGDLSLRLLTKEYLEALARAEMR
jgi:hypothetical protein